jgi:hypothetical protein
MTAMERGDVGAVLMMAAPGFRRAVEAEMTGATWLAAPGHLM